MILKVGQRDPDEPKRLRNDLGRRACEAIEQYWSAPRMTWVVSMAYCYG